MGRHQKNTVDFFPHFISDGKKMFFIENKYGNDGYSTWYKILEKLASTENHFLNLNQEEEIIYLAAKCRVSEDTLISIINDLSRIGAFNKMLWEAKIIWSQKFIDEIQEAYSRRNNKCITFDDLCKHLIDLCILKNDFCNKKDDINTQSRVDKSRVDNIVPTYRSFKHLKITTAEVEKLISFGFSKNQIDDILDRIENYKKNSSYASLYLTTKNWLQRDYPIQTLEQNEFLSQL